MAWSVDRQLVIESIKKVDLRCITDFFMFFNLALLPRFTSVIMQNEAGENVDLYVPRKCSWTNRLVRAKDHSSVQINVANVDPVTGIATGDATPYCLAGYIRFKSEGDLAFTALVQKNDTALLTGSEE